MDAAISAWVTEERNRVLGQELTEEENLRAGMASAAQKKVPNDREKFKVPGITRRRAA